MDLPNNSDRTVPPLALIRNCYRQQEFDVDLAALFSRMSISCDDQMTSVLSKAILAFFNQYEPGCRHRSGEDSEVSGIDFTVARQQLLSIGAVQISGSAI